MPSNGSVTKQQPLSPSAKDGKESVERADHKGLKSAPEPSRNSRLAFTSKFSSTWIHISQEDLIQFSAKLPAEIKIRVMGRKLESKHVDDWLS